MMQAYAVSHKNIGLSYIFSCNEYAFLDFINFWHERFINTSD